MTLETPAQVRHQLALELAMARILGMTREARVEAMRADGAAWRSAKAKVRRKRPAAQPGQMRLFDDAQESR